MTLNDLCVFFQDCDLGEDDQQSSILAVSHSSQRHRNTMLTLSKGANVPESCGGVLWACWAFVFLAIQKKPMAKQSS